MKVNVNVKEVTGYNVDISEVKGIKSEVVGDDVRTANVELNYDDASVDINLVPVFKDNNNLSFEGAKEVLSALVEDTKPFSYNKDDDDLLERLAELEHEQWCEWSKNVFADLKYFINIIDSYGTKNILDEDDEEFFNSQIERSKRWGQLWKPYNELSEGMKEEDRKYARKVLKGITKMNDKTKISKALEMYATDGYSLGKCVEVSGLSHIEFLKLLNEKDMPYTLYE